MINYSDIVKILWEKWNPIGLEKISDDDDEYNGYARQLCSMINNGSGYDEIFSYLKWASKENMGLSYFDENRAIDTANAIIDIIKISE
ncbi:hypothetical protein PX699_19535 [Sphingobium sp. H39-3-25]|uniref:hypothetical protein n=1 Tax=Sphingobium arseniciresistens TaxID=3030834 RepID=UPI0023B938C9|nr:hypothetical protein [Sphingobium arseniciresistens]